MSSSCGVRVTGPLAMYADGFRADLIAQGYAVEPANRNLRTMAHVGHGAQIPVRRLHRIPLGDQVSPEPVRIHRQRARHPDPARTAHRCLLPGSIPVPEASTGNDYAASVTSHTAPTRRPGTSQPGSPDIILAGA